MIIVNKTYVSGNYWTERQYEMFHPLGLLPRDHTYREGDIPFDSKDYGLAWAEIKIESKDAASALMSLAKFTNSTEVLMVFMNQLGRRVVRRLLFWGIFLGNWKGNLCKSIIVFRRKIIIFPYFKLSRITRMLKFTFKTF